MEAGAETHLAKRVSVGLLGLRGVDSFRHVAGSEGAMRLPKRKTPLQTYEISIFFRGAPTVSESCDPFVARLPEPLTRCPRLRLPPFASSG